MNLKQLDIALYAADQIETVMSSPMTNLREVNLTLDWPATEDEKKKIRKICEKGCENAKKIRIFAMF